MVEWLKTLIFSALNRSLFHRYGFTSKTSQVLLAGGLVFFSRGSPVFGPPYDSK